jgi:hypothetical protein
MVGARLLSVQNEEMRMSLNDQSLKEKTKTLTNVASLLGDIAREAVYISNSTSFEVGEIAVFGDDEDYSFDDDLQEDIRQSLKDIEGKIAEIRKEID